MPQRCLFSGAALKSPPLPRCRYLLCRRHRLFSHADATLPPHYRHQVLFALHLLFMLLPLMMPPPPPRLAAAEAASAAEPLAVAIEISLRRGCQLPPRRR